MTNPTCIPVSLNDLGALGGADYTAGVMTRRSPVHEIVNKLWRALGELGAAAEIGQIEQWGFSIHEALSAPGREFHTHTHVLEIATGDDPLQVIAALYHDAVYIQLDHGLPRSMRDEIERGLVLAEGGWRVQAHAVDDPAVADVMAVFGRRVGDVVGPTTGLNELASALVASVHLADVLDRSQRIAIAACIEQTIPFRPDAVAPLRDRLAGLGLAGQDLDVTLERAVRLANRDVENFAEGDPARFLDNTWKLLPESNPALHTPILYTVRDYRVALQKMEGFLAWLPPDRVFHAWGDEPGRNVHADRVARTTRNLALAVRYLRAKLYSIAVIEALAELSGGDVPLDYFMGGLKSPHGADSARIEAYLPDPDKPATLDPDLQRLLAEGRASESTFDTAASPVSAFLHAGVGEPGMMQGLETARQWWAGSVAAHEFLAAQPTAAVVAIARAAATIMQTRRDRLLALAQRQAS
jgi:hypothetical protein